MDKVIIEGLRIDTFIGVYAWEKSVKQTLLLDLELSCDLQKAAATDQVFDTLDYAAVVDAIVAFTSARHFQLLEALADNLAKFLLDKFSVQHIKLSLRKPGAIAQAAVVGVQIERSKK